MVKLFGTDQVDCRAWEQRSCIVPGNSRIGVLNIPELLIEGRGRSHADLCLLQTITLQPVVQYLYKQLFVAQRRKKCCHLYL